MPLKTFSAVAVLIAGCALSTAAFADRHSREVTRFVYADVVDVKPLIRTVEVEVPVRECFERPQREAPREGRGVGRTIAGGIIGGLIGSQIGDGSGRKAATIAGVLIGASSGNDADRNAPEREHARYCETRYEYESRDRVEGFRVTYEYRGETFVARTKSDPGDQIRIRVSVAPVVD
ncbi:MAG: glycine zipper 2TM domain-containing protein [Pseudomonadota bacterium]